MSRWKIARRWLRNRMVWGLGGFVLGTIFQAVAGGLVWDAVVNFAKEQRLSQVLDDYGLIAFLEPDGERYRLFTIRPSGRDETLVASEAYPPIVWSPFGRYLAFVSRLKSDGRAALISVYDSDQRQLVRSFDVSYMSVWSGGRPGGLIWSPTGRWLFASDGGRVDRSNIFAFSIATGELSRTTLFGVVEDFSRSMYLYGRLWFVGFRGDLNDSSFLLHGIVVSEWRCGLSPLGAVSTFDPADAFRAAGYAYKPIIYAVHASPSWGVLALEAGLHDHRDIWLYGFASGSMRRVTDNHLAQNASWSPSGELLAYLRLPGTSGQEVSTTALGLYVIELGAGRERQLIPAQNGLVTVSRQAWSLDGRFLSFGRPAKQVSMGPFFAAEPKVLEASAGLFLYDFESGNTRRISERKAWGPAWAPARYSGEPAVACDEAG